VHGVIQALCNIVRIFPMISILLQIKIEAELAYRYGFNEGKRYEIVH